MCHDGGQVPGVRTENGFLYTMPPIGPGLDRKTRTVGILAWSVGAKGLEPLTSSV